MHSSRLPLHDRLVLVDLHQLLGGGHVDAATGAVAAAVGRLSAAGVPTGGGAVLVSVAAHPSLAFAVSDVLPEARLLLSAAAGGVARRLAVEVGRLAARRAGLFGEVVIVSGAGCLAGPVRDLTTRSVEVTVLCPADRMALALAEAATHAWTLPSSSDAAA